MPHNHAVSHGDGDAGGAARRRGKERSGRWGRGRKSGRRESRGGGRLSMPHTTSDVALLSLTNSLKRQVVYRDKIVEVPVDRLVTVEKPVRSRLPPRATLRARSSILKES